VTAIVPDRRPKAARIAGFLALLTAVSWALGTLAAWPWAATPAGEARLRISLRYVSGFEEAARPDEQTGGRLRHMRPVEGTSGRTARRARARLTVSIHGRPVLTRTYQPTGLRRDGPIYGYEEIAVTAGRHRVAVTLTDLGQTERRWSIEREVEFPPGHAPLLEYAPGRGWLPREEHHD
jgi:hypothetical protein